MSLVLSGVENKTCSTAPLIHAAPLHLVCMCDPHPLPTIRNASPSPMSPPPPFSARRPPFKERETDVTIFFFLCKRETKMRGLINRNKEKIIWRNVRRRDNQKQREKLDSVLSWNLFLAKSVLIENSKFYRSLMTKQNSAWALKLCSRDIKIHSTEKKKFAVLWKHRENQSVMHFLENDTK